MIALAESPKRVELIRSLVTSGDGRDSVDQEGVLWGWGEGTAGVLEVSYALIRGGCKGVYIG